jgi:hypothetical protein
MTTPHSPEFSYDVYPGLDAELEAALARNIAAGNADPAAIATAGLAAAIAETVVQPDISTDWTSVEARKWGLVELASALSSWSEYPFSTEVQYELQALIETKPETLSRLYESRENLIASGENTTQGLNIGESMHITLVPWKMMLENLEGHDDFQQWVNKMRLYQDKTLNPQDNLDPNLLVEIRDDSAIYHNPASPKKYDANGSTEQEWISAKSYLQQRIAKDGPWGVALIQTSPNYGVQSLADTSVDELTGQGSRHIEIGGERVDGLGIFEWIAMTLQHEPADFTRYKSLLLANRIRYPGCEYVPTGLYQAGGRFSCKMDPADQSNFYSRPRLAVL